MAFCPGFMPLDVRDTICGADTDWSRDNRCHYVTTHRTTLVAVRRVRTAIVLPAGSALSMTTGHAHSQPIWPKAAPRLSTSCARLNVMREGAMCDAFLRASADDGRRDVSSRLLRRSLGCQSPLPLLPRASHRFSPLPAPPDTTGLPDIDDEIIKSRNQYITKKSKMAQKFMDTITINLWQKKRLVEKKNLS